MDLLNDHCQLDIIKYLNLKDQLALCGATNTVPTSRWTTNLQDVWAKNLSYILNWDHIKIFNKNPEVLKQFLTSISRTVQHLEIHFFDSVNDSTWISDNYAVSRSIIFELIEGSKLERWQDLRDLLIYDLHLNEEHFNPFECLPKLRTLTLGPLSSENMIHLINMRGKQITKLVLNSRFDSVNLKKVLALRAAILSDNISYKNLCKEVFVVDSVEMMNKIFYYLEHFWNLVASCPTLKILYLLEPSLDGEFLDENIHIKETLKIRSTPFILNLNTVRVRHIRHRFLKFKHPKMRISFDPVDTEEIFEHCAKFYLDATNNE